MENVEEKKPENIVEKKKEPERLVVEFKDNAELKKAFFNILNQAGMKATGVITNYVKRCVKAGKIV